MKKTCCKSCRDRENGECRDSRVECPEIVAAGYCTSDKRIARICCKSCEEAEIPKELEVETPTEQVSEIPTEKESEIPREESEITTEKESENSTEKESETPTKKESEIPREKESEIPTEKESEIPTEKESENPTEQESNIPTDTKTENPTDPKTPGLDTQQYACPHGEVSAVWDMPRYSGHLAVATTRNKLFIVNYKGKIKYGNKDLLKYLRSSGFDEPEQPLDAAVTTPLGSESQQKFQIFFKGKESDIYYFLKYFNSLIT